MDTRMKHMLSLMSAAATACTLLAAFQASVLEMNANALTVPYDGGQHDLTFRKGDCSLNHSVNAGDAQWILMDYVTTLSGKPSLFYDDQRILADIDENGKIDILDAQYVLMYSTDDFAGKTVKWADYIGKELKCFEVVVSTDTLNGWIRKSYH